MEPELEVDGRDVDIKLLTPLNERSLIFQTHAGFRKIVASIKAVGLIEPLNVFQENSHYVILDG